MLNNPSHWIIWQILESFLLQTLCPLYLFGELKTNLQWVDLCFSGYFASFTWQIMIYFLKMSSELKYTYPMTLPGIIYTCLKTINMLGSSIKTWSTYRWTDVWKEPDRHTQSSFINKDIYIYIYIYNLWKILTNEMPQLH